MVGLYGYPYVKYRFLVAIFIGLVPFPLIIDMAFSSVSGLGYKRNLIRHAGITTFGDHAPDLRTLELKRGVFGPSALSIAQLLQLPFFSRKIGT
jgi:hypothetical protein